VIKVIWGSDWDPLFARQGRPAAVGAWARSSTASTRSTRRREGAYIREHFFGKYPELLDLVSGISDEQIRKLRRGGHDPAKVYAAYKRRRPQEGRRR
jgi:pyruvate dehydrogenase E1 component